jgi:hypothetical protein
LSGGGGAGRTYSVAAGAQSGSSNDGPLARSGSEYRNGVRGNPSHAMFANRLRGRTAAGESSAESNESRDPRDGAQPSAESTSNLPPIPSPPRLQRYRNTPDGGCKPDPSGPYCHDFGPRDDDNQPPPPVV